ncbi:kinase-like protein, partial [Saccharata proteae CBS 121410]
PQYPNQSYAALHAQQYPSGYPPSLLRTRSSHPSSHIPSTSLDHDAIEPGSRTTGNSPSGSPGLFNPLNPPVRPTLAPPEEPGYYSSPYLHYTHRQAPKETHVADVDVDPISGRKIINEYEIIDELGRGVHGKVKLGRSLGTGQYVAIKIVDRYSKRRRLGKNTSHEDKIRKEIAILKKARHPNIVSLLEVIDDPSRKKVYIVLEHVEMGEVRWRTEGAKEIVYLEYRRCTREAGGIFDSDSEALEDQRILQEAARRRERAERRRMRRLNRQRQKVAGTESWSFEHGGDSDEDESGNDEEALPPSKQSSTSLPVMSDDAQLKRQRSTSLTGLEGTMYGAYEPVPRGRNPSIAGSSSSHAHEASDFLDEVPEHFRYVPLMTLGAARAAFRDTVLGLEYLHYQGVIHRDIKPANLLQTIDHRIKISDFGVSYLGRRSAAPYGGDQSESDAQDADEAVELAKTVGTPAFYAPELCQTDVDVDNMPVSGQIDVWALGVTLYCLVFGRVPFHDLNTFVVMRLIAEEDVYIPRIRLRAVDDRSGSRPGSHSRFFNNNSNKRGPHDLHYEAVEDDLYDLLKRLFCKDPRKRINLTSIKHHPWVLKDIADPGAWLDETDPSKQTQGKRIEVSRKDVDDAVAQLNVIERITSTIGKIGRTLGLSRSSDKTKKRTKSSANESGMSSAASSSSTISQDARRPSLKVDDPILAALKASREGEHPLSQSVTASPEPKEHAQFFIGPSSRPETPDDSQNSMSTAGSIRTLKQSDFESTMNRRRGASPTMPQGVPSTPLTLDPPGASNLSGIFGGATRMLRSVRSKETGDKKGHGREKSIDRLVHGDDNPHGEPSIAVSEAVAAGHVDTPFFRSSSNSSAASPGSPNARALHDSDMIRQGSPPSRQSSISFDRAREENLRRRLLEEAQGTSSGASSRPVSRAGPQVSRPPSALSQAPCPPSPDDDLYLAKQQQASPAHQSAASHLTSSSSEDQFYSGMSQSTSNPSIPSVMSADSSVMQDETAVPDPHKEAAGSPGETTSVDTVRPDEGATEDFAGYDGDHAVEDDDESDEEDFIVMSKKPKDKRSGSITYAELARHKSHASKSSRSGSNGTVKKVRAFSGSDQGSAHGKLEAAPEAPAP